MKKIIDAFYGTLDHWKDYLDYSYVREGQDVRYAIDDTRIRDLGWAPQKIFDNEINGIVNHYKENTRW